jgi:hypothetical protein
MDLAAALFAGAALGDGFGGRQRASAGKIDEMRRANQYGSAKGPADMAPPHILMAIKEQGWRSS